MTTRLLLTLILFVVWLFGCVGVEPADPTLIERIFAHQHHGEL
ncbi:MAG: hypothetical protein QOJ42_4274 [Acidobacteriaceae bacterium]|jgi:hypothetical protein|nr:hypothetical protein [Acidobacteriaceae bacterium]